MVNSDEQKDLKAHVSGNLSDTYIISLLKRQGVPITEETLDLKRCAIVMKRTRRMLKNKRKIKRRLIRSAYSDNKKRVTVV